MSLRHDRRQMLSNQVAAAEDLLQDVECQIAKDMAERQQTLISGQKNAEVK